MLLLSDKKCIWYLGSLDAVGLMRLVGCSSRGYNEQENKFTLEK